jgi:hypothetical protein
MNILIYPNRKPPLAAAAFTRNILVTPIQTASCTCLLSPLLRTFLLLQSTAACRRRLYYEHTYYSNQPPPAAATCLPDWPRRATFTKASLLHFLIIKKAPLIAKRGFFLIEKFYSVMIIFLVSFWFSNSRV